MANTPNKKPNNNNRRMGRSRRSLRAEIIRRRNVPSKPGASNVVNLAALLRQKGAPLSGAGRDAGPTGDREEDFDEDLELSDEELEELNNAQYSEEDESEQLEQQQERAEQSQSDQNRQQEQDSLEKAREQKAERPADKRGEDPQSRQIDPKTRASKTPDTRTVTEYGGKAGKQTMKTGSQIGKQAASKAGQASGQAAKGAAEKAAKSGVKAGTKAAGSAVKTGARAAGKAAQAGAKIAAQLGARVASVVIPFIVANIGPILIVILLIGLGAGIASLIGGGSRGGTLSQPADLSNPTVKEAIERLATLAGDEEIRQITSAKELTESGIIEFLDKVEEEIAGKPNSEAIVAGPLATAKTLAQEIVGGTEDIEDKLKELFQNLDELINLTLGVTVKTPQELASRAISAVGDSGNWVGSTNDNPKSTSLPLRDGSNVVGGKRGCDPSGFITYLIRGNDSNCILCLSPNAVDLPKTFSTILKPSKVGEDFDAESLEDGDIIITSKEVDNETHYGLFVFSDSQKRVYFCSSDGGPRSEDEAILFQDNRQINQILKVSRPQLTE